ncbi:MAG: nitroreductase family protein [Desulfobulbaceae bacterium DB1]|nr:MAG: nitroreductase family protein [Desulfobulbaceae bacterium DB1]
MNSRLDFIFSRRSIRKYENKDVPEETLHDLLEAGMAAPSAVAKDPWHFIVLRKRENIDKLAAVLPHGKMLRQATAAFVVCGDIARTHDRKESYMLQDLSAAVENILLAANGLGLGTCWLGVHPRAERMEAIKKMFTLPETIIPMCAIAIGWPAEQPEPRTRFRQECVHMENW